jgi:flagellar motor component MotA
MTEKLSHIFLAVVLTHGITIFAWMLWQNSSLLVVALPIIFAFVLGCQLTTLINTSKE